MMSHVTWKYRLMIFKGHGMFMYIYVLLFVYRSYHATSLGWVYCNSMSGLALYPTPLYIHCFLYVAATWIASACHCAYRQEIK